MTSRFEAWNEEILCKNVSLIDVGPSVEEQTILFMEAQDRPSVEEYTILFMEAQDRMKKGLYSKWHNSVLETPFLAHDQPIRSLEREVLCEISSLDNIGLSVEERGILFMVAPMTSQFEAWNEEELCKNVSLIDAGPSVKEQTILIMEGKDLKDGMILKPEVILCDFPSEHLLTFNKHKDAKSLFEAIEARFGGKEATKKTQKTLLKQMYENFNASSTESLDFVFNRLQKIISQLAILGEIRSQEDLNLKFLRSLPAEWNTHVVVWRNKPDLETMSIDDLYNNFKIVEQEVKRSITSSSNTGSQNLMLLLLLIARYASLNRTPMIISFLNVRSLTRCVVSKLVLAATAYFLWRERNDRLFKKGKNTVDHVIGSIKSSVRLKLLSCRFKKSKAGLDILKQWNISEALLSTASSSLSAASNSDNAANLNDATVYAFLANQPNGSQLVHEDLEQIHEDDLEVMDLKWQLALLSMRARRYFQKTGNKITINGSDIAGYDKTKTQRYIVRVNKSVCENASKEVKKTSDAPIIEDWVSDCDEDESIVKMVQKHVLNNEKKGTGQRVVKPIWNNIMRTNHQNFSNSRRNFAPIAVLTKSGLVPISTARQSSSRVAVSVSTPRPIKSVAPKPFVNVAKSRQNVFQKSHSPSRRPLYQQAALKHRNLNNKVNTVKVNFVNTAKAKGVTSDVGGKGLMLLSPQHARQTQVGDEVVHKELGDRMERAVTTASSFEAKQDSGNIKLRPNSW
ncbi:hypothetical protein Tco_0957583 [Tanacetum coccineum]